MEEEVELTTIQKMIVVAGVSQLIVELLDDVLSDPDFKFAFVREHKLNANNLQRSSIGLITRLTHGQEDDVRDQLNDTYAVIDKLIKTGLIWPEKV